MNLRIAVHSGAFNKELRGDIGTGWKNRTATLDQLVAWVKGKGHCWFASWTNHPEKRRQVAHCDKSNVVVLDIDGDCSLEQFWQTTTAKDWCALTYTTASHMVVDEKHPVAEPRFRAIFPLGRMLTSVAEHKGAYLLISSRLLADLGLESLRDSAGLTPERIWYGNTGAEVKRNGTAHVPEDWLENIAQDIPDDDFTGNSSATDDDIKRCQWILTEFLHGSEEGEYKTKYEKVLTACAQLGKEAMFEAWLAWVDKGWHGQWPECRSADKWNGLGKSSNPCYLSIYSLARQQDPNWTNKIPARIPAFRVPGQGVGYHHSQEDPLPEDEVKEITAVLDEDPAPEPLTSDQQKTKNKKKKYPTEYAKERLRYMQQVKECFPNLRLNLLTNNIEYDHPTRGKVILQGDDLDTMTFQLVDETGIYIPEAPLARCISYLAKRNPYCPVQQYLNRCEKLEAHTKWNRLGAELLGNDHPVATSTLQRFLIGAVARAFNPACSMSWIPILVGPQGAGKSMLARSLVPDELFAEITTPLEILSKEQYRLHTAFLLELPEVDNYFSVKNIENFKNLITTRVDETRRPYDKQPIKLPRRFVMIGTTNRNQFLVDATGNRRFMPLEIGPNFLVPWQRIAKERDQLWAAAIQAYRKQTQYEFSSGEIAEYAAYIQEFGDPDPWADEVRKWLDRQPIPFNKDTKKYRPKEVHASEVLSQALHIDPKMQNRRESRRAAEILTGLGYRRFETSRKVEGSGKTKSVRLWIQPDVEFKAELKKFLEKNPHRVMMPPDADY